jgi:hypothetical protein
MSSAYLKSKIGNHLLRTTSYTKPTTVYVSLFTAGGEAAGSGYGRVQCGPDDSKWTESPTGTFRNASAVEFGAPTGDWGEIIGFKLHDHVSAGNELSGIGYLPTPRLVLNGDLPPSFAAGALAVVIS